MAKVKTMVKAPKSAKVKKKNCKKKSLTGKNDDAVKDNRVMRRPSNLQLLTSDEKVRYLLENGLRLGEKLAKKRSSKETNEKETAITKSKSKVPTVRDRLMTRSGRIKKKHKNDLKLMNNILKSELMIEDKTKGKKRKIGTTKSVIRRNNNNDTETSDQNKKHKSEKKNGSNITNTRKKRKLNTKKASGKKESKPKQVKLSNGLVLKLSTVQCDYCKKTFSNKFSLRRHIFGHLYSKPYSCSYCPKKFQYINNRKIHEKKQHSDVTNEPGIFVCDVCKKPFLLKENLGLHLASHVKNENSYKCIYCDRQFSHHLLLNQHEKQHLVRGRYQCSLCTMSYEYRNQLAAHVKSHLKIKDFICQYCGKDFLRLNSMRRHVQICHGGHRIQCPICNKSLKGHLTEHMRTHEKNRPHECPDCGQSFTQSTQLNVHRRSHTGYKPYKCRICDKSFSHSNAMMLHIRRHTGEKPFVCALCPLSFSQLPHMKAHMRNIHGKDNPYKCKKCNQFFKLKVQLESHVKTCKVELEKKNNSSLQSEDVEFESAMTLTRMRFLLALLFTMIASKEKLKCLGA